jgi:hypothetical protein
MPLRWLTNLLKKYKLRKSRKNNPKTNPTSKPAD